MKKVLLGILLIAGAGKAYYDYATSRVTRQWITNFEEGLSRAQKEKKPVFATFYEPRSDFGKKFEKFTADAQFTQSLQSNFVLVKLHTPWFYEEPPPDNVAHFQRLFGNASAPISMLMRPDGLKLAEFIPIEDSGIIAGEVEFRRAVAAEGKKYEIAPPRVGQIAPDFVARELGGKLLRLSDFRGKVLLLDFFQPG